MVDQLKHYQAKLAFEIDSADLASLFQNGKSKEMIIVIDARSAASYETEHIPGAMSFPHRTMTAETVKTLDRQALYITYCDGIGCNASTKGAMKLATLGFNVKELIGGLDWWKRDGYSTEGWEGVQRSMQVQCAC